MTGSIVNVQLEGPEFYYFALQNSALLICSAQIKELMSKNILCVKHSALLPVPDNTAFEVLQDSSLITQYRNFFETCKPGTKITVLCKWLEGLNISEYLLQFNIKLVTAADNESEIVMYFVKE